MCGTDSRCQGTGRDDVIPESPRKKVHNKGHPENLSHRKIQIKDALKTFGKEDSIAGV